MEYSEYSKSVAKELSKYPFLKWQNKKTARLVRKLYKEGYPIKQTVQFCILNN
ncbi:hypothetical protein [uncultured Chryseobacterium sp.]|uniref:hypothetical protein n=1 Tax=uncultured Chryseobacterium sp. TaxID=259322 RepID=UPI00258F2FFB|nr:hypothetical protein [uncultured Chryseobacterium sp.]